MKRVFSLLVLSLFLGTSFEAVQAQETISPGSTPSMFARLQQYDSLVIVLETDLQLLKQDRTEEPWQPGVFQVKSGDSVVWEQQVHVAARGNMRKKTCYYPPIKIRFQEALAPGDTLADVHELKLVVGCGNTTQDQQLVAREQLAYDLYNVITPESFRTKSAKVVFTSPGKKRSARATSAFFIESENEMAQRLGGRPLKPRIISPKTLDSVAYTRVCVFQYMIGNTDFGAYSRHNVKIVGFSERRPVAVPYDFDYAGLVNADYAVPSEDVPVKSVRERYYVGLCHSSDLYETVLTEFRAAKVALLARCAQHPDLSPASRQEVQAYLLDFFAILENPARVRKEIVEHCNYRVKK